MSKLNILFSVFAFIGVWNINQVNCDFNSTEDYTLDNYLESRAVLDVLRERDNLIDPNFLVRQGLSGINFLKAFALTALLLKPYIQLPYRIYVPAQQQQELIKDIPTTTDIPAQTDADLVVPSPPRPKYQPKPFLDNIECMAEKVIRLPQHHANREMFLQINIRCKPMRPKENMMPLGIKFNIEVPETMFSEEQLMSMEVPPLEEFLPRTRGTTTKSTTIKPNKFLEITEEYRPIESLKITEQNGVLQILEITEENRPIESLEVTEENHPIESLEITEEYHPIQITDRPSTEYSVGNVYERPDKPFYWMNNYYPSSYLNKLNSQTIDNLSAISNFTEDTVSTTKMPWYLSVDLKATTGKPIYWMNMFYPNGVPGLNLNLNASSTEIPETTTMRKRRRRTRSTTTTTTTTQAPEWEYYDMEEENVEKKTKKRRKPLINSI